MKKKIPLTIRRILEKVLKDKDQPFTIHHDLYSSVLILKDKDPVSNFYFDIKNINSINVNKRVTYHIDYKPYSEETLKSKFETVHPEELKNRILEWRELLIKFNEESPIFDDKIVQAYYEEIEPEFEILDEDAAFKPYPIKQQKKIILFLDKAKEIIKKEDDPEIENIVSTIDTIKNSISKMTKKEVVTKIREVIARGFKIGLRVGEKLLIEFSTELVKKMITS